MIGIALAFVAIGLGLFQWYYTVVTGTSPHPILATILFISGGVCLTFGIVALYKWLPVEFPSKVKQRNLPLKQPKKIAPAAVQQVSTTNWLNPDVVGPLLVLVLIIASFAVLFLREGLQKHELSDPITNEQAAYVADSLRDHVNYLRVFKKTGNKGQIFRVQTAKCKALATQFETIFKSAHISELSAPTTTETPLSRGLFIFCEPGDGLATELSLALDKMKIHNQLIETITLYRKGYFIVTISDQWF